MRLRLLRWMELVLALGLEALLLIAWAYRPSGFHSASPTPASGGVSAASAPALIRPSPTPLPGTRQLLDGAARRHGLPAHLVEAVAYWESGWDESKVSDTGAVGLMQIQPDVASELGPKLLGRTADIHSAADNADLGAAILKAYIDDQGGDVDRGLAAYYQGPQSLQDDGIQPDTQSYVDGVDALRGRLDQGQPLPPPPGS